MNTGKSEFGLIDWIAQHARPVGRDVVKGIGDDMAVMQVGAETILMTTDTLLEAVHFDLASATFEQVGYKAMACSLSDCAAMAAEPIAAVIAVALANRMSLTEAQQLFAGAQRAAQLYDCAIVGGDTTSWDQPLAVNVTMLATCSDHKPVLRSGARADDVIMVTGQLGGSSTGKHLTFEPRLAEAKLLAESVDLHAMIDISDGLSSDLLHICRASGVAAVVDAEALPLSAAARRTAEPIDAALGDGEDFELLFCVSPADAEKLQGCWPDRSSVLLSRIGRITPCGSIGQGDEHRTFLRRADGSVEPMKPSGWEHFRD